MSPAVFTIQFGNPYATYYSGQQVTGQVFLRLSKSKKLQGIQLNCTGSASVYWRGERKVEKHGKSETETCHYNFHELYFQNTFFVLGGPSGEITLPRGEHFYPFQLTLPPIIPSSFEGKFGHVRYTVKGIICRPWKFDHECKVAFTVLNPLDLNLETNIQAPIHRIVEKTLCCCCCRSPAITLVVMMPFTGFVPGQKCEAVIEVDNPTKKNVTVQCALVQNVTFTAYCDSTTQTKQVGNVIGRHKMGTVTRRSSITSPLDLRIPAVPTSYLRNCNSIQISYKLEITGSVSGLHRDMRVDVPIVIGTIPLRTQFPSLMPRTAQVSDVPVNQTPQPTWSSEATGAVGPSAPPDPLNDYPEMMPPTYEECMSGKRNIRSEDDNEYVQGTMQFAPRYPTYAFK